MKPTLRITGPIDKIFNAAAFTKEGDVNVFILPEVSCPDIIIAANQVQKRTGTTLEVIARGCIASASGNWLLTISDGKAHIADINSLCEATEAGPRGTLVATGATHAYVCSVGGSAVIMLIIGRFVRIYQYRAEVLTEIACVQADGAQSATDNYAVPPHEKVRSMIIRGGQYAMFYEYTLA
jgi:hypothetical protein